MGGALVAGWRRARAFSPGELMVRDPYAGGEALAAAEAGARLNPADGDLAAANTVILAVKPQAWLQAAEAAAPHLAAAAVVVSIMAGVETEALRAAFGGRDLARVMPTTAAAIGQGTASIYSASPAGRARARLLFEPLGVVVDLEDEALLHAATAVSGSGPAYLYAFIEALESAGTAAGLNLDTARRLAASTVTGAAALLAGGDETPEALRRQVTSPGGTTEAALNVLIGERGLADLMERAVAAAAARSRALGG